MAVVPPAQQPASRRKLQASTPSPCRSGAGRACRTSALSAPISERQGDTVCGWPASGLGDPERLNTGRRRTSLYIVTGILLVSARRDVPCATSRRATHLRRKHETGRDQHSNPRSRLRANAPMYKPYSCSLHARSRWMEYMDHGAWYCRLRILSCAHARRDPKASGCARAWPQSPHGAETSSH